MSYPSQQSCQGTFKVVNIIGGINLWPQNCLFSIKSLPNEPWSMSRSKMVRSTYQHHIPRTPIEPPRVQRVEGSMRVPEIIVNYIWSLRHPNFCHFHHKLQLHHSSYQQKLKNRMCSPIQIEHKNAPMAGELFNVIDMYLHQCVHRYFLQQP